MYTGIIRGILYDNIQKCILTGARRDYGMDKRRGWVA
jgi:hypothetical protein